MNGDAGRKRSAPLHCRLLTGSVSQRQMDHLSSIRIFTRVAELGSFSKAADELVLSQSTVTKHIAWLESHLGARLLNRNTVIFLFFLQPSLPAQEQVAS